MQERRQHQLKQLTSGTQPNFCIYFDTESHVRPRPDDPGTLEHSPYLLCATFCRYDTKGPGKSIIYAHNDGEPTPNPHFWDGADLTNYEPINQFWDDIDKFTKAGKSTIIYAHNVGYDINVTHAIDHLVVKHGYTVTSFFDKGSYILKLEKQITPKRKKTLTFLSTGNYFPGTLKNIAKTFGFPDKIDYDFETGTFLEAIPYCERDTEICKVAMEGFRKLLTDYDLGPLRSTVAGQAFATFCYKFYDTTKPIFIHDHEKVTKLERESYHGGRVECFKLGHYTGDFYKLDVNSMYPSVMLANRYPTKLISYRAKCTLTQLKNYLKKGYGVVARVTVQESEISPHLPYQGKTKLIFPGGTYDVTLATPEVVYSLNKGIIKEVHEVAVYEMHNIFKDYVAFFYEQRNAAKTKKDNMLSNMFKLFLNSLYGKFGQKSDNWSIIGPCDPTLFHVEQVYDPTNNTKKELKYLGGSVFQKEKETEAYNAFCAIASHVTSYARQILATFIEYAGRENVYYCDTDSLFTNKLAYEKILVSGGIDNKELGKLKLESTHKEMWLWGAKDYKLDDKTTLKGIGKSDKKLSETTYECQQWPKQNGLIRKGKYNSYATITRIKHLARVYKGGLKTPNGDVMPFVI